MTAPAQATREREREDRVPAYVDMARLCFELSISERTADAWVKKGIIPPPVVKDGKRLWKWKTVERRLDGEETGVAPSAPRSAEEVKNATIRALAETRQ